MPLGYEQSVASPDEPQSGAKGLCIEVTPRGSGQEVAVGGETAVGTEAEVDWLAASGASIERDLWEIEAVLELLEEGCESVSAVFRPAGLKSSSFLTGRDAANKFSNELLPVFYMSEKRNHRPHHHHPKPQRRRTSGRRRRRWKSNNGQLRL
jgi:hypothetical protein